MRFSSFQKYSFLWINSYLFSWCGEFPLIPIFPTTLVPFSLIFHQMFIFQTHLKIKCCLLSDGRRTIGYVTHLTCTARSSGSMGEWISTTLSYPRGRLASSLLTESSGKGAVIIYVTRGGGRVEESRGGQRIECTQFKGWGQNFSARTLRRGAKSGCMGSEGDKFSVCRNLKIPPPPGVT